jgi:hypothetical protein
VPTFKRCSTSAPVLFPPRRSASTASTHGFFPVTGPNSTIFWQAFELPAAGGGPAAPPPAPPPPPPRPGLGRGRGERRRGVPSRMGGKRGKEAVRE